MAGIGMVSAVSGPAAAGGAATMSTPIPQWWDVPGRTCVAAYMPRGAANQAASYIDLTGNGNDCILGIAPAWDPVNGWDSTAGGGPWLDTQVVWTLTWTIIVRFSNILNTAAYTFGCDNGAATNRLGYVTTLASARGYFNGASGAVLVAPPISGVVAIADRSGYLNGALDTAAIGAGVVPVPTVAFMGVHRGAGVVAAQQVMIQAAAIYSATLTAPEIAALTVVVAAL